MTDFLLNACGDLDFTDGRLTIVTGVDAIRQRWLIYIRTYLGEWYLDVTIGVPYYQRVLVKAVSRDVLKQVFRDATLEVPGVTQVVSVIVDSLDVATRMAEVTVTCTVTGAEGPETGVFRYTGEIPPQGCGPATAAPAVIGTSIQWYWFDPSDLAFVAGNPGPYVPGNPVVLENKFEAEAGSALGTGATNPQITVALNARKALPLVGDAKLVTGFGQYGDNIRALRASTGYSGGASFTIFGVYKPTTDPGAGFDPLYTFNGSDSAGLVQHWINVAVGNVGGELVLRFSSEVDGVAPTFVDSVPAAGVAPTDVWALAQRYELGEAINAQFWVNGTQVLNTGTGGGSTVCHTDGEACWNGNIDSLGALGEITPLTAGELIGYRGQLTDAEIAAIFAYLLPKWGI